MEDWTHMRRLRIIGLCVVALLALGAVAASAAMAEDPAIYECAKAAKEGKTYKGHYSSKKCEASSYHAEGGQKYELQEWNKAKPKAFKGKGGGANLEIEGVGGVTCTKSSNTGQFTGGKSAGKITAIFTGCLLHSDPCTSAGAKSGEVKTKALDGVVGWISKAKEEVGVELKAEAGLYEAEFVCGELNLRVSGAVIGLVKPPYNHFTKEVTLVFEQSGGVQKPTKLEGGPTAGLFTEIDEGVKHPSAESTEVTGKGEELELQA
jgi:hypothetical protein